MLTIRNTVLFIAMLTGAGGVARAASESPGAALDPGAFTVAWLTDTQYYTEPYGDIGTFLKITDWIKRHKEERNIRFLVHTGDITNRNTSTQWSRATECMRVLDNVIPCFLAVGNHDMGENGKTAQRDVSYFNEHFHAGDNPLTANAICAIYQRGHLENAAYFHDCGKWHLLILSLEFATPPAVIEWADKVVSAYPDRKVILITHDFIDYNSMRLSEDGRPWRSDDRPILGHAAGYPIAKVEPIETAQDIWDRLIDKHPNFILTLNGHFGAEDKDGKRIPMSVSSYRADKTRHGNYVLQVMYNPQFLKEGPAPGGHGWIRLLEFEPDGETIKFRTFSPFYAMDRDPGTNPELQGEWEQFSANITTGVREKLQ